jgi:hypothetical protein
LVGSLPLPLERQLLELEVYRELLVASVESAQSLVLVVGVVELLVIHLTKALTL